MTNTAGCDSTATLNLTIKQPTTSSTPISNCVSYTWNNVTYTASGTYTKSGLTNAAGCDSTAYLVLTIKQPTTSSTPISNCVSYTWNNVTYTASGTYIKSGLTNAAGCDSTATLNLTIKQPTTSTTTISNCGSYIWNGITYSSSGIYTWNSTNAAGCDSVATLNLTIQPITGVKTVTAACVTYTWSSNSTVYTQSGTYYYTKDCRRDTLILTINANPTNVAITAANSVCGSSAGNLASANATGTGLSYIWTITNGTITSGNGSAAIVYTAGASGSVNLGVTASSSAGCSTSATPKSVTTLSAPNALITVASSVCPSATGLVASVSSAGTGASYAWTITNGTITSGRTSRSMQFTAGATGTVSLSVRVTSRNGCFSIGTTIVNIASLATPVVTASGSTSLCPGGTVILTAPSGFTYLWSSGQTTQSITVSTSGNYSVRVTNASRCSATSAATTVTVNAAPTVPIITAAGSTTFCQGGSVTLTSSTAASYLWSTGATTQSITVNTGGVYFVKVFNAGGCSATSTNLTVTVNPLVATPVITASGSTSLCTGGSVTLSAPLGYTYLWSSGQTTQSITVSISGNYSVRVTNSSGCSATSAATTVTVNTAPTVPIITATGSTTFCQGGSVILTSSTAASYLWSTGATTQSITVNTGGVYFVKVFNAGGCSATSVNTTVTVNPLVTPTISISSNAPATISGNTSVTFTATINGGGTTPIYQWKKNGTNVGTNSANYINNSWVNGDAITCMLTSNYPCATTTNVTSNSIRLSVTNVSVPKFLVVDVTQNRGYYYDSSFNFISSNAMSTGTLYGVTNASDVHAFGGFVYVADGVNMRLYRSNAPASVSSVSKTLRTQTGSNISSLKGLTINGDSLWVLDQAGKAIYRYSLSATFNGSGSINALAKINISNAKGESLCADNGNLYVLDDDKDRSLYRYNKSGSFSSRSKIMKTSAGLALGSGTGAVIDVNGRVWVTDQINDKSYSYSLSSLFTGTGNLNASSEFTLLNSSPTNANATGITLVNSTTVLRSTTDTVEYVVAKPESFQYEIYPNPTRSEYHMIVKSKNKSSQNSIKARILDVQGRQIKTFTFNSNETIDFGNDLKTGVYMVELREGDKVKTIRVVKF